jgi:hypothetical protein
MSIFGPICGKTINFTPDLGTNKGEVGGSSPMSKLRVHSFAMSLDGYGTGPRQSLDNPLGAGGLALHEWAFNTRTVHKMHGKDGGSSGVDDDFVARGFDNIGAWIIGRNMFGPVRGPWPDDTWKGWWCEDPPYHTPVFVLTHHPRNYIQLRCGRHPGCTCARSRGVARKRHPVGRRGCHNPGIPPRWTCR